MPVRGGDTISLQASTTYLLTRPGEDDNGVNGDRDVLKSVTIIGAGPASTIIDANGVVTADRVMQIVHGVVAVQSGGRQQESNLPGNG